MGGVGDAMSLLLRPISLATSQKPEMGLYAFCLAGGVLVVIGIYEALVSSLAHLSLSSSPPLSPPLQFKKPYKTPFLSSISFISASLISFFFILNALISLRDALHAKDRIGFAFQLQIASIASLFLLYSVVGVLMNFTSSVPLPSSIHSLIALFAFGQEFLHFYLQRKDAGGLENRYFDLMLVPVMICVFSAVLEFGFPKSNWAGFVRGVGLILQGTWFVQMGFSFFTDLMMARGCALHERSSGNFTVKCKGHMDDHRSKAIATLQFNCHLAFLIVAVLCVYSFVARKYGINEDYLNYTPLNAELRQLHSQAQFTLDSDDDENDEIMVEHNGVKTKSIGAAPELGVNGFGDH